MPSDIESQLAKASLADAPATIDSLPPSELSSPNTSRPPSPLLRPLQHKPVSKANGLPNKPFGFNALSGASMSFTAMANSAAKKQQDLGSKPSSKTNSPEASDDESSGSSDEHKGQATDEARPRPPRRTSSVAMAPFITKFDPYEPEHVFDEKSGTRSPAKLEKVAIVGSGSWGTALARVAAINAAEREGFDPEVRMWVREREVCLPDIFRLPALTFIPDTRPR